MGILPNHRRALLVATLLLGMMFPFVNCGQINTASSSNQTVLGSSAHDLLSDDTYTALVIEIQYVTGFAPSTAAQNALVTFLQTRLNKPGGITVHVDAPLAPPGKTSYSLNDVLTIELANRTQHNSGNQITAYFLFLDGNSTSDSGSGQILGTAYSPSSMVIYEKSIQANSGSLGKPSRSVLEETVLEHEFGHILGLVNVGSPPLAVHQDAAHGAHCTNTSCLMFWQVDTSNFVANLLGGSVPTLDADCINDLRANGGK